MGKRSTSTSAFGSGRREGHDASAFYQRFAAPELSDDDDVNRPDALLDKLGDGQVFVGNGADMSELADNSVALVVTSPPYFVGKDYELAVGHGTSGTGRGEIPSTYVEFLEMLRSVFAECRRVLEPGGRIAVNVANLGRKPYRSLSADVITILQDDLGLLLRGEVIWEKSATSSGSCAWGSFAKASNPVLRDMTERVIIASKGRFQRARTVPQRRKEGLPHVSTLTNDEFVDVTRDVWRIDAESATRVGHPAPFPIDLPRRLIDLYTYVDDIVVDPFVGSGTTLVAAARAGRIGVGYDTDAEYATLAEDRLAAELDRRRRLETVDQESSELSTLQGDERQDLFHARAVAEGRRVHDMARRVLEDAGFEIDDKAKHPAGVVDFDFLVTGASGSFWVEVAGGFTASKPGLQRIESVWRLLGRLHTVVGPSADGIPVIVLTSSLPKKNSSVGKALRAPGSKAIFDVIEIYDPEALKRLVHYASSKAKRVKPQPGFWSEPDL